MSDWMKPVDDVMVMEHYEIEPEVGEEYPVERINNEEIRIRGRAPEGARERRECRLHQVLFEGN